MRSWRFTIISFTVSYTFLLIFEDLLANFIITYTLKGSRATWLRHIEGYLASLHDFVSVKVEHMIYSRMIRITKKNTIGRP
jgi:hypothetical protein